MSSVPECGRPPARAERDVADVFRRLDRWSRGLPAPLREAAVELPRALGARPGESLVDAWGERLGFLITAPITVARRYRSAALDRFARDAAYGAVAGYFYIRIQDNVLDEPECFDSSYLLLGNALVAEFFTTYARLFPPRHRFWHYFSRYWTETSRFTLWEKVTHGGALTPFAERDLHRLGKKHGAAKIPVAAVCLAAGRETDVPRYARFLDRAHLANQLLNDVRSVTKDLAHRHLSYVAGRALQASGTTGRCPDEIVGRALLTTELEDVLDRARRELRIGLARLGPLGRGLEDAVDRQIRAIADVRDAIVRAKVTTLLELAGIGDGRDATGQGAGRYGGEDDSRRDVAVAQSNGTPATGRQKARCE